MPALFTLPSQEPLSAAGAPMAGCTLTFSATGSATPQDTYQDIDLTIPHENPVEADAAGVFDPIYLDPSLPNYRAVLKTSAGVTLKTWDDIPSNQNTAQTLRLKSTAPALIFEETDASANNGRWAIRVNNEQFVIELLNDNESLNEEVLVLNRSGMTPNTVFAESTNGEFTGTLTGMSASGTGIVVYSITRNICTLRTLISGTSNSTAMTMTGLPAAVRPTVSAVAVPCYLTDNGAVCGGWARMTSGGDTITFGKGFDNNTSGFTNSGTKGLASGWTISYPIS